MSDTTINQHYIPQFILKNFCNEKEQVYECLVNREKIYVTNIKNSMVGRYTYEHPYFEKNRIEKWFSRIEDYTGPAINRILSTIENHGIGNIEFKLIRDLVNIYLSTFIIFYYRSGALLYEYSFGRKNKDDRILIMTKKLMNSKYIRALSKTIVQNYNFAIIKSDQSKFLMSDQFLSTAALSIKNRFFQISNRHMGLKDTIILIPISKNYYAVYYHGNVPKCIHQNKINTLDELQVSDINRIIINNAYLKCITHSKEALKKALGEFEYESPTEMIAGSDNGPHLGATLKKEIFFYYRDQKAWELMSFMNKWDIYDDISRNDKCPCGSKEKYKKCCLEALEIAKRIIAPFAAVQAYPFASINMVKDAVSINATIEMPIEEFSSR